VYGTVSVDSAASSLDAAVQDTMEQAIPRGVINYKSKFLLWYSSFLSYYSYIRKNIFTDALKKKSYCFYQNCSFYRKLVRATVKSGRLRWLKSTHENLKQQPQQIWK
jgi:hypothetical protein